MQRSNTILSELREISPVVADLPVNLPFQVPAGYFDQLAERLLVKSISGEESAVITRAKTDVPYSVPEGYFDHLAQDILNRVHTEGLAPDQEINLLSPVLGKLDKKSPFSVPEGYFQETPSNVVAGMKALDFVQSELEILSPQLIALKESLVYTAPAGYFEALPAEILSKVRPEAKVVRGNFSKLVTRFAVAAAVIGIMAIGLWTYNRDAETSLASDTVSTDIDSSLNNISDAAIINYIENNGVLILEPANSSAVNMQEEDVREMLADVSDRDLETYLQAYGITEENLNTN